MLLAAFLLKELREIDPPVQMITTLDVEDGAHDEHPDSFSGEVGLEADEHILLRLGNVALVAQTDALNKEVFFLRNKLKQWKASSAKRDLRSSLESPPAERITFQQPERPASSGRRASVATGRHTPLVEFGRPKSKDADDEESRGEGLRRPMSAPPSVNQIDFSEASRRRATMPSSSGVKCTSKQKHTS